MPTPQLITLLPETAMSSAITGTAVRYDPLFNSVGCAIIEIKQWQASPVPTMADCPIHIQGSVDGNDWVTLYVTNATLLTKPLGVSLDAGAGSGGYRSQAQVVQAMPWMRVCTANSLTNGSSAKISVFMQNG